VRATPRSVRMLVAAVAALALATACSGPQAGGGDSGASAEDSTLSVFLYQKPTGVFSPLAPASGPDQQVMSLIYDSLMTTDPDLQLVPQLAEKVDVSPDVKTFTFTLPSGVTWSDGQPFSSADVLFTFQVMANPKSTSALAGTMRGVEGVQAVADGTATEASGFSAPDDTHFVIRTTEPNYGILAQIARTAIIPKHVLGSVPIEQLAANPFFRNPTVGTGPYQFVANQVDQYVELTANPHYREPVGVKHLFLKPVTADVATAQLGTGEMDIANVSPTERPTVEGLENIALSTSKDGGFVRITLNQTQPRFADPRVRQAMLYAIDRKAIVDAALPGVGTVRSSSFDPSVSGQLPDYAFDPAKAKQLLSEAGWDSSKPVTLAWIAGSNPDRDAAATAVQNQLSAVGVNVELKQVDAAYPSAAFKDMSYDLFLFGGGNYAADSWTVNTIVACDQGTPVGGNVGKFCDPQLDTLMKQANATADQAARLQLYKQAAAEENQQVSYLWLYNAGALWAVNKRVQNFTGLSPIGGGFWHPEDWAVTAG
jgi:ABC-type transport system substrate-binding protein